MAFVRFRAICAGSACTQVCSPVGLSRSGQGRQGDGATHPQTQQSLRPHKVTYYLERRDPNFPSKMKGGVAGVSRSRTAK
jgi:hypothetical protein